MSAPAITDEMKAKAAAILARKAALEAAAAAGPAVTPPPKPDYDELRDAYEEAVEAFRQAQGNVDVAYDDARYREDELRDAARALGEHLMVDVVEGPRRV